MLVIEDDKRHGVILHGESNTGKSHVGKFTSNIFISYAKNETKEMYDEKITPKEANV